MAHGVIDKLTNFIMSVEEEKVADNIVVQEKKSHLRLHTPASMTMFVGTPLNLDDICTYADHLKNHTAVLINLEYIDAETKTRIIDFLNGVCYIIGGSTERVSDRVMLYAPPNIEINKELFAYSIPTYVKQKADF